MNEPAIASVDNVPVPEEPRQAYTIVQYLELKREKHIIVPISPHRNSRGTMDAARWIELEALDVALADLRKVEELVAQVNALTTENAQLKLDLQGKSRRRPAPKKAPVRKKR